MTRSSWARRNAGAIIAFGISVAVFWRTAYPTITWWDSSQYSLAASTLGVTGPPGSLLLTLIGWPVAHLQPDASPAHMLNLLAGALAALTVALVFLVALRMRAVSGITNYYPAAAAIGAGLGVLAFAFSDTLWEHATKFTPYVLTTVFTALILGTMLRWWEEANRPEAWRRLAVLGLLFGLDFSVHRTNALLLPGALAWILIRHPQTLGRARAWLAGGAGLLAGLAVQLLLIPLAALTRSPLNFSEPSSWPTFWDYVSLKYLGGSFLLQLFPRKASFWSVQVADLLHMLGANFLHWAPAPKALGVLPALAALFGLTMLWRSNRRLAVAFALVLFLQMASTVLYFNIPANFFRPFDRHYLPVCVTIAVSIAYGLATVTSWVAETMRMRKRVVGVGAAVLAGLVPVSELTSNWTARDASNRYFARDYAANALEGLPPNAIYFTVGDNDTFPVMYVQAVEGVRPDVTILNLPVANFPRYGDQLRRRDPSFPLALTTEQRAAMGAKPWTTLTLAIPVVGAAEQLGLPAGTMHPDSIVVQVKPASGPTMYLSDAILLDIVRTNRWKRPLTFAISGNRGAMAWLARYGRADGLFWRIVPVIDPPSDASLLRDNLLTHSEYRGFADRSVRVDEWSQRMGALQYGALEWLLDADRARGDMERCRADARTIDALLPPDRLGTPAHRCE